MSAMLAERPVADQLLTLQALDTEADQLRIRRDRLPERQDLATRTSALTAWEERRRALRSRIDELSTAMEEAEVRSGALENDKARLEAQLKTVIAPREAEALMHEIATAEEQLAAIETQELADLSEVTAAEEQLAAHLLDEGALRDGLEGADGALALAVADIDRQLADLEDRRTVERDAIEAALLERYDRLRDQHGVAIAKLVGHRCEGCHLDLSAAEVDTAKDEAAATGIADCPQCGRMLAV